ncbi:hypothetical protein [Laspinema olomoucense]|uniref:PEP-CTERM protein-sorting domain-containing protein n=1 Tax=Laspinema olomoucense D3b TaxID=2953688 RepID=A0ABT2NB02_9CYAN|nr:MULTISPECIES: hypothetical protein [unclassified Laspinema]MCT7979883.1 hypothetical protein [Laspinema sp. D3b]MCT7990217.1 hypothetical protein [Laspinema sp. D3a]
MMFLKLSLGLVCVSIVQIGLSGFIPVSAASAEVPSPHQGMMMDCSEADQCTFRGASTIEWEAPTSQKIPEPGMVTAIILSGLGIVSSQKRRFVTDK